MGSPSLLTAPERIHYFYGLLLDADRLQQEQDYFNRKRWLLNRLEFGSGVLRGLGIAADAATPGTLSIDPGVAIDGFGREIIVPATVKVDATKLTDDRGNPAGPVPAGSTVIVSLAYMENQIDPVPVLVADCDHPGNCAPAMIREGFRVLVRVAQGPPPPPVNGIPLPAGAALHEELAAFISGLFPAAPADPSVALARFALPGGPLDAASDRRLVYSNAMLFQIAVSLLDRVNAAAAGTQLLLYVSGDNQSGAASTQLAQPLVVQLQDGSGNPVNGATVQFTVTSGGGTVTATTALAGGEYSTQWTLGAPGAQIVEAKTAGSTLTVTFEAHVL